MALFYEAGRPSQSISQLLTNPRLLKPLFRYIHATGRFRAHLGEMYLPPGARKDNKQKPHKASTDVAR